MAIGYKQQSQASVTLPPNGAQYTFIDSSDGRLKRKDSSGVVVDIEAADAGMTELVGEVTAIGVGTVTTTMVNSAVIGKVLTGLSEQYGAILAADSILSAFKKLVHNSAMHLKLINSDLTVPSNYQMIRGETEIGSGVTLTVEPNATLTII